MLTTKDTREDIAQPLAARADRIRAGVRSTVVSER